MRSNLEDNRGQKLDLASILLGCDRRTLTGNIELPADGPVLYFLNGGGASRNVTLPAMKRGRTHAIINIGASHALSVQLPSAGGELVSLGIGEAALFVCSGNEWKYLTNTIGDALDPSEVTSPDGSILVTTNVGAIEITVAEGAVDHNSLLNFVANKHIDHTTVEIQTAANSGLAGGGTIAATRALTLDINNLTADTPVLADSFAFLDAGGGDTNKATLTTLNGILDHNGLLNYSANRHIDHTAVSINTGTGLTGGGDISSTRTISLNLTALTADTPVAADEFFFFDVGGSDYNKVTGANLITALDLLTATAAALAYQPLDSFLTSIALLGTAADKMIYTTAANTAAETNLTVVGRTAVGLADPGVDGIIFWDDSASSSAFLTLSGLTITTTTLTVDAATESAAGKVELATTAEAEAGTDTARAVTPAGLKAAIIGKKTVNLLTAGMIKRTTNGPTFASAERATNDVMYSGYSFSAGTEQALQIKFPLPKSFDSTVLPTFRFYWTTDTAGTGNVMWGARTRFGRDDDAQDAAFGTGVTVTDAFIADGDDHISAESTGVTAAGTHAAECYLYVEIYRKAADGSDTYSQTAVLEAVMMKYGDNAMTDD